MSRLVLRGGRVVTPAGVRTADVTVDGDRITAIGPALGTDPATSGDTVVLDVAGTTVAPGFVDVHVHAAGGVWPRTADEIATMARALASGGVTSFLLGVIAGPHAEMTGQVRAAAQAAGATGTQSGARCLGVHLEGPWVSASMCGALPAQHFTAPTASAVSELCDAGPVRLVTLAPEIEGGMGAVRQLRERGVIVSLGHSDATFADAAVAVEAGASHVTHAFNAMRGLHHREPGLAGAALDLPGLTVEVIADGNHVHPAAVRTLWRSRGPNGVCLVSDSVDGGLDSVHRDGHSFRTADGRLAGSALALADAVRNVVTWGLPVADALQMASATPARAIGADELGSISVGARADLVVLDHDLRVRWTIVGGTVVHDAGTGDGATA